MTFVIYLNDGAMTGKLYLPTLVQYLCGRYRTKSMPTKEFHFFQDFFVVGINYKKTDTGVRGDYAINASQYEALLDLAPTFGIKEFFIVSTCNRTEIYGLAPDVNLLTDFLFTACEGDKKLFQKLCYRKKSAAAIEHLFKVAAGLDSQILGDYEILGQIKNAVKTSKAKGRTGAFTERLVNCVIQSSKAVKTQTQLSSGTVSVSFAAIQYIKQCYPSVAGKTISVVGMGKIGKSTCKNLLSYLGPSEICIINRTNETAELLAEELNVQYCPYENLAAQVSVSDIVIVSTNSPTPVIDCTHLEGYGEKLIIDLSVPNNVAPEAAALSGITLVDVDCLSKIKDETLELRKAEVPKANAIISKHIAEFGEWLNMRRYVPVLKDLKNKLSTLVPENNLLNEATVVAGLDSREATIQNVINLTASKLRSIPTPGCLYIAAINDYIGSNA